MNFKIRKSVILLGSIYCINNSYCMETEYDKYQHDNNNQNQINLSNENKSNEENKNSIQNINERIQKAIDYLNKRLSDYFLKTKISSISNKYEKLLSMDNIFDYISSLNSLYDSIQNNKNVISKEQIEQIEYMENRIKTDSNIKNKILAIFKKRKLEQELKESIKKKEASKLTEKGNNINNNTKINVEIEKKEKEQAKGKKAKKVYKLDKKMNNTNCTNNMKIDIEMENKITEQAQEQEMKEIVNHTISINNAKKYISGKNDRSNINVRLFFQELAKTADEIIKNNRVHELKLLRNSFKNEPGINKDANTWEQKFAWCLAHYIDLKMYDRESNILDILSSMLDHNDINNSQYESLLKLLLYTDYIACLSQKSYSFDEIDKLIKEVDKIIVNRINRKYYKNIVLDLVKPTLKEQISHEFEKFDIDNSKNNQKLRYKNILNFAFKDLKSILIDGLTYAILPVIEQNAIEQGKQFKIDQGKELNRIKKLLKDNNTINDTINRCIIQILNLPEYLEYINKCCNDVIKSNNKLNENTISFIKGMENIKGAKKDDYKNKDTLLFCKYIVKELNSLINNKVALNAKEYKVKQYLLFDIFLRHDYMLYNLDTHTFHKYITELYNSKEISNDEYKSGLDFLLYQDILSSGYLIDDVLASYINVFLPTSEKDWRNIIANDIRNNMTKQNSVLINEIMRKIIEKFNDWNGFAKMIYDYENKNNYFKFYERKITNDKQKYILEKILNNTNYDMFYNIYLNKHNTFNEFYTLLAMFKKYKNININKTDINKININKIEKDNEYSISNILDNFYELYKNDTNMNKKLFSANKNWNIDNKQTMPDNPLNIILKYTLSSVLSTEQKVYILSNVIHKITKSSYNEYIENYINNIIKYCNLDYKKLISQEINDSENSGKILREILEISINKDNTIDDLININKILQIYSNNLKYTRSSSETISSVNTLIYILGDFLSKFDLEKNHDFRKLTLNDIIGINSNNNKITNKNKNNKDEKESNNFLEEID